MHMANDDISPDEADPIMSILIVEDYIAIAKCVAKAVESILSKYSRRCEVNIARNADEARTLICKNNYDLIVLDINLDSNLSLEDKLTKKDSYVNGFVLLEDIKNGDATNGLVVFTGLVSDNNENQVTSEYDLENRLNKDFPDRHKLIHKSWELDTKTCDVPEMDVNIDISISNLKQYLEGDVNSGLYLTSLALITSLGKEKEVLEEQKKDLEHQRCGLNDEEKAHAVGIINKKILQLKHGLDDANKRLLDNTPPILKITKSRCFIPPFTLELCGFSHDGDGYPKLKLYSSDRSDEPFLFPNSLDGIRAAYFYYNLAVSRILREPYLSHEDKKKSMLCRGLGGNFERAVKNIFYKPPVSLTKDVIDKHLYESVYRQGYVLLNSVIRKGFEKCTELRFP